MPSETNPSSNEPSSRRFRKQRLGGLLVVFVLIFLAPTIIAKTTLRDRLINAAIADESLTASTRSASLGYLAPLSMQGFDLQADDGSLQVEMESMTCDKSWLMMLFSHGNLGGFHFRQPTVRMVTGIRPGPNDSDANSDTETNSPSAQKTIKSVPTLSAEVQDARVQLRSVGRREPAIDLQEINFTIRTEQRDFGSLIEVDPTTILDEEQLTPELCNRGVQLIAPMLADALSVQGRISFRLDHCSIPVGDIDQEQKLIHTEIDGTLKLTGVSVSLNNQIAAAFIEVLKGFGRIEQQIELTVSRSSEVRFHVVEGRVHHQGLMFLLPIGNADFELHSSGSVGFDETLDLEIALGLPDSFLGAGPVAQFLTSDPIVIKVVGQVSDPQVQLSSNNAWRNRLQRMLDTIETRREEESDTLEPGSEGTDDRSRDTQDPIDAENETVGRVLNIVDGLLNRANERETRPRSTLLDQIRNGEAQESSPPRRPGLLRRRQRPE